MPAEGSTITLRGYVSGSKDATVKSTNFKTVIDYKDGTTVSAKHMIKVNKAMQEGDSGGGAIGGVIDGGRTNCIIGINRASSSSSTLLVKGEYILDAY